MARSARTRRGGKTKDRVISLDFTDVDLEGGGGFRIKEGEYLMKCSKVEDTESEAGNSMFKWEFTGAEGAAKGKKFYLYTVYDPPDSLWKLGQLLTAMGQEVPDGPMDLDLDEMVDLEIIGHVEDEEYEGKMYSRLRDFSSVDGDGNDGKDDNKTTTRNRGKDDKSSGRSSRKSKKELEAMTADEVKELDEDGMQEVIDKYELDVDLSEHKTPRRKSSAVIAALEEKDLLSAD